MLLWYIYKFIPFSMNIRMLFFSNRINSFFTSVMYCVNGLSKLCLSLSSKGIVKHTHIHTHTHFLHTVKGKDCRKRKVKCIDPLSSIVGPILFSFWIDDLEIRVNLTIPCFENSRQRRVDIKLQGNLNRT